MSNSTLETSINIDDQEYKIKIRFINGVKFVLEEDFNVQSEYFNSFQEKLFKNQTEELDQISVYYTLILTKVKTFKKVDDILEKIPSFELFYYENVPYLYLKINKDNLMNLDTLEYLHKERLLRYKVYGYKNKQDSESNKSSFASDFHSLRKKLGFLTIDEQLEVKRNKELQRKERLNK